MPPLRMQWQYWLLFGIQCVAYFGISSLFFLTVGAREERRRAERGEGVASPAPPACAGCLIERRDEFQLAQHVLYMKGFMFLSTGFLGLVFYGGSDMYCAAAASPETLLACLHDVSPGRRASYAAECVLYSLQADCHQHRRVSS